MGPRFNDLGNWAGPWEEEVVVSSKTTKESCSFNYEYKFEGGFMTSGFFYGECSRNRGFEGGIRPLLLRRDRRDPSFKARVSHRFISSFHLVY